MVPRGPTSLVARVRALEREARVGSFVVYGHRSADRCAGPRGCGGSGDHTCATCWQFRGLWPQKCRHVHGVSADTCTGSRPTRARGLGHTCAGPANQPLSSAAGRVELQLPRAPCGLLRRRRQPAPAMAAGRFGRYRLLGGARQRRARAGPASRRGCRD